MTLNPIQFGKDVIAQFGRYLLTTFAPADPHLAEQYRKGLSFGPDTSRTPRVTGTTYHLVTLAGHTGTTYHLVTLAGQASQ